MEQKMKTQADKLGEGASKLGSELWGGAKGMGSGAKKGFQEGGAKEGGPKTSQKARKLGSQLWGGAKGAGSGAKKGFKAAGVKKTAKKGKKR
ncbi:MAG: hypothetical protein WAN74_07410 [Thermoplasmata archaeon]